MLQNDKVSQTGQTGHLSPEDLWGLLMANGLEMLPGVEDGGRVGVLPKQQLAEAGGKMVIWEKVAGGVVASKQVFAGFRGTDTDLLFVAEEDSLLNLWGDSRKDPIRKLREGIRGGSVMLYFLRSKADLLDLGYEELVDLLGLPLSGCR